MGVATRTGGWGGLDLLPSTPHMLASHVLNVLWCDVHVVDDVEQETGGDSRVVDLYSR